MTAARGATAASGAAPGARLRPEPGTRSASGTASAAGFVDEHLRVDPGTPPRPAAPGRGAGDNGRAVGRGADPGAGDGGAAGGGAAGLADCADVLWLGSSPPLTRPAARRRVRSLLARHPGCLVVAVPTAGGCLVGLRCGAVLLLLAREPATAAPAATAAPVTPAAPGDAGVPAPPGGELASVVHAWLVARLPVAALHRAVLRTPAGTVEVRLPAGG